MMNFYKSMFRGEEAGCPFGKRDCRADSGCERNELCVGGKCIDRCGTEFNYYNDDANCDPCTETCTAGYCQKIAGEVEMFELGFETFEAYFQTMAQNDPANAGKTCMAVRDQITDGTDTASGALTATVGECAKHLLFHPDDAPELKVTSCPEGADGQAVMEEYQPSAGDQCSAQELLVTHTVSVTAAGDACTKVATVLSDNVQRYLRGAGLDAAAMAKLSPARYATGKCSGGKLELIFSPNADCSATPGGFEAGFCAKAGNAFDAGSCCLDSIIQAETCVYPNRAKLHNKLAKRMEEACGKPGNKGVCPAQPGRLQTCLATTKVKKALTMALDAQQAAAWASLSEAEQKQAVTKMFGGNADAVQTVSIDAGTMVVNLEADSAAVANIEGRMRNTANDAAANNQAEVGTTITKSDGTSVTVGVSASAAKSAAGPETFSASGAASFAASAVIVVAAAAAGMAL